MITKIGKIIAAMRTIPRSNANTNTGAYIKNYTGSNRYLLETANDPTYSVPRLVNADSSASSGVNIGSGTTAATEDDYCLENRLYGVISGSVSFGSQAYRDGKIIQELLVAVTNTSASDITVGEIGLVCGYYGTSNSSAGTSMSSSYFLIDRTVLDTPITIPSGETATITYTLELAV